MIDGFFDEISKENTEGPRRVISSLGEYHVFVRYVNKTFCKTVTISVQKGAEAAKEINFNILQVIGGLSVFSRGRARIPNVRVPNYYLANFLPKNA